MLPKRERMFEPGWFMTQSPETAGGAGFTFEDAALAIFLAALLGEENAPGLAGRIVVRVACQ